jgi:hypothetical protein
MKLMRVAFLGAVLVGAACENSAAPSSGVSGSFTVTLTPSSCHPRPSQPCALRATVTSPNGLSSFQQAQFVWSGCASGSGPEVTCVVDRPGPVTASVEVTDDRGRTIRGSGTGEGTNLPPVPTILGIVFESAGSLEAFARHNDPEDPAGCGSIQRVVTASNDCKSGYGICTAGNLDIGGIKTASAGTCTLTYTAVDEWGATGTVTKSFPFVAR